MRTFLSMIRSAAILSVSISSALAGPYSIGPDNWLIQGGKPVLPVGIYSVPRNEMTGLKATGFNFATNPFWANEQPDADSYLAAAMTNGLSLVVGFLTPETSDLSSVTHFVDSVKHAPNLLAYYMPDEAVSEQRIPVSKLESLYRTIKAADSTALVMLTDYEPAVAQSTKAAYDIFAFDLYPVGEIPLSAYRTILRDTVAAAAPKPLWATVQAYARDQRFFEPTADELRAMAYIALVNGAKGLMAYQHCSATCSSFYIKDHPVLWRAVQNLADELRKNADILTAPTTNLIRADTGSAPIDWTVRQLNDRYFLIGVNYGSAKAPLVGHYPGQALNGTQIKLTGIYDGTATIVAGGVVGTQLTIKGGAFSDSIAAYGAKIYEIVPNNEMPAPTGLHIVK